MSRQAIVARAVRIADEVGLEGLTIGRLADELSLSKGGVFAHFGSKEALQVATVDLAADGFVHTVVDPSFAAGRGEPQLAALFTSWLSWSSGALGPGAFFVSAAAEFGGRHGPVRNRLVLLTRDWLDTLAHAARNAVSEGHFRADLDAVQLAFETQGIMLIAHHGHRLLADGAAHDRARAAFDGIMQRARVTDVGTLPAPC